MLPLCIHRSLPLFPKPVIPLISQWVAFYMSPYRKSTKLSTVLFLSKWYRHPFSQWDHESADESVISEFIESPVRMSSSIRLLRLWLRDISSYRQLWDSTDSEDQSDRCTGPHLVENLIIKNAFCEAPSVCRWWMSCVSLLPGVSVVFSQGESCQCHTERRLVPSLTELIWRLAGTR